MGKLERIVGTGEISVIEKNEIASGAYGNPPQKKIKKLTPNVNQILEQKAKYSRIIADPVGVIKSDFLTKCGTPHQPGRLKSNATIQLSHGDTGTETGILRQRWMPKDVLEGLEEYSHCWLLFHFHLNDPQSNGKKSKVAPPRAGGKKVGIFASRAPYRPSPIGLSLVKIVSIDKNRGKVVVQNCDLVNETPILGIIINSNNNFNLDF